MNYKEEIIAAINEFIVENSMYDYIFQSQEKNKFYIKHEYWLSIINVSLNKWKTEYWIDIYISFLWRKNMQYFTVDSSMSFFDYSTKNRYVFELEKINDKNTIGIEIKDLMKQFVDWDNTNTISYINCNYMKNHYSPDNVWFNINKAMLAFLNHQYVEGKKYFNIAKNNKQYLTSLETIRPFIEIIDNEEKVIKTIADICEENFNRYLKNEFK